jgi:hypothetical protein
MRVNAPEICAGASVDTTSDCDSALRTASDTTVTSDESTGVPVNGEIAHDESRAILERSRGEQRTGGPDPRRAQDHIDADEQHERAERVRAAECDASPVEMRAGVRGGEEDAGKSERHDEDGTSKHPIGQSDLNDGDFRERGDDDEYAT